MFLNLIVSNFTVLNQIGLVVIDEAQFITDPRRGISIELLLTFLITARERGVNPQILALSAVIGNTNNLDVWLGCNRLITTTRPVPLVEGVLDRTGIYQFIDTNGEQRTQQLLPYGSIRVRGKEPSAQDVIIPLVRQLTQAGEKVIIFRNQRGPAQGCAKYLSEELGLPPANTTMAKLPNHDLSTTSVMLRECLSGGTAFHNTNLTREEKSIIERSFRSQKGEVKVLAATTTVAAGINTPASTVILAKQEFIGDDGRPFTVAEYKNMAGRAGRLGFNEQGKAIILAETSLDRCNLFKRYVLGTPESMQSSFQASELPTWIVRLLVQVKRIVKNEVVKLLSNTYGGYLAARDHPDWRNKISSSLEEILEQMIKLGLVETEGEYVNLTLLGRACGSSSLSFDSALRLVELLRNIGGSNTSAEKLVAVLQALPESDGGYTPLMKRGRIESIRPQQASNKYGTDIVRALQRYAGDEFNYFARCKRASILWDWINGVPVEMIEETYSPNPYQGRIGHGDIRRFADATRFHLRAAYQITTVLFINEIQKEELIETILKQLELGIPAGALRLTELPISLSRGEYLALYKNGITSTDDYWKTPKENIIAVLGETRVKELEAKRTNYLTYSG